ncbi:uncharacterized protein LOC100908640 [Galendromus occidentalis]|uniref:Uncharacterized protein LOC100908640 n=1 Tax=Galendromus occidentalis TaxID=34638 RepID=A0AAJ6VXI3_9ACAR|nr:uncharacterized protein LOC100908640 [Galendromus occidentalis]
MAEQYPGHGEGIHIRELRPEEVESAAKFWFEDLGFDVGVRLFQRWYDQDPEAFRCIVDENGTIVATASAVRQTEGLYYIGTVGVDEAHRGRGLAKRLIRSLRRRDPNANYGLSAVPSYLSLYEGLGFQVVEQPFAHIYKGALREPLKKTQRPEGTELLEIFNGHPRFQEIEDYDARIHGYRRELGKTLIDDEDGVVYAMVRRERIIGFGKVQSNQRDQGAWFGPVYADDDESAQYIFSQLLERFQRQAQTSIYVIVSYLARHWAEELNLQLIEKSPRCYVNVDQVPAMLYQHLYAFDSLDFSLM